MDQSFGHPQPQRVQEQPGLPDTARKVIIFQENVMGRKVVSVDYQKIILCHFFSSCLPFVNVMAGEDENRQ